MKTIATFMLAMMISACAWGATSATPCMAPEKLESHVAKKMETVVFTVTPAMSCANCENRIKSNLRFEKGVKAIETSLKDQTVTVRYNPAKATPESLAKGLAKIGYKATVVPGAETTK